MCPRRVDTLAGDSRTGGGGRPAQRLALPRRCNRHSCEQNRNANELGKRHSYNHTHISITVLIHSSSHPFIHSSSHPPNHSSTHPFVHSSTHPLVPSSTYSLILSSTHPPITITTHSLTILVCVIPRDTIRTKAQLESSLKISIKCPMKVLDLSKLPQ